MFSISSTAGWFITTISLLYCSFSLNAMPSSTIAVATMSKFSFLINLFIASSPIPYPPAFKTGNIFLPGCYLFIVL